jgi:pyruvate/2-oxoacid:ferredoxin oxidoreductase alpha subunit
MKKVIKLTETQFKNKIKSLIKEQSEDIVESSDLPSIMSLLIFSQTQVHIFHLQTKSHAEHVALNEYYDTIDDLVDEFIESYQGEFGIIEEYKSYKIETYQDSEQVVAYFNMLLNEVKKGRETIKSTHLQNILDEIITLITKTMYKIKFLK